MKARAAMRKGGDLICTRSVRACVQQVEADRRTHRRAKTPSTRARTRPRARRDLPRPWPPLHVRFYQHSLGLSSEQSAPHTGTSGGGTMHSLHCWATGNHDGHLRLRQTLSGCACSVACSRHSAEVHFTRAYIIYIPLRFRILGERKTRSDNGAFEWLPANKHSYRLVCYVHEAIYPQGRQSLQRWDWIGKQMQSEWKL